MAALGTDYHFVAKGEVQTMPFIGTFVRKLGHFAFDRASSKARLRQAGEMVRALQDGESIFLFPEGTFTSAPAIRPFHLGAFKAAASVGCPILPVALTGTRSFLRDGTWLPRPAHLTVTVCPPVEPRPSHDGLEWQEVVRLRDSTREAIHNIVGEPIL